MEPTPAPLDAGRPAQGAAEAHGGGERAPIPPDITFAARLLLALALVISGVTVDAGGASGLVRPGVVTVGVIVVALGIADRSRHWSPAGRAARWGAVGAATVVGAALGSRGHGAIAVIVVLPLAWSGGLVGDPRLAGAGPVAAGVAGLVAGVLTGAAGLVDTAAVGAAAAVGGWAAWAGWAAADEISIAARERLELRRIRTEMVTTVSHELRTPLTVIQGATATLSRRWDVLSEPERLDLVDVLAENVASLDASIMHFADAARLERGEVVLAPEWVAVRDVLHASIGRRAAALAGHEVRPDIGVETVWADRVALERIIEHLLLNAARFSALGLPINLRVTAGSGEVTLTVADQGQGIAPRLLSTVWEPLQRGDVADTGVSRGAGLGLPIVRELARLHGGDAVLSSVRGRGTTVSVTLPQPAADATATPAWERPVRRDPPPAPRRGALSPRSG
ncbi:MAG: hypothetical protein NVSMB12_11860 [Acidimicrobiales bacterium]